MKREIRGVVAPTPMGPYSHAIDSHQFVFCSGFVGLDPATGDLVEGIAAQTARALENIAEVLKAAGLTLADVVKTTVFMADLGEFSSMNEEYAKHFSKPYPARSTVQVAAIPRGAKVEIEVVAARQ